MYFHSQNVLTLQKKLQQPFKITDWLPTTLEEVKKRDWDYIDVILFTGDAYVDHPSFGAAVIGRTLEYLGLRVAIVPQPNWQDDLRDFKKLGVPRLFFAVTSGNMDSMVNHYTANRRLRSDDAYTAGGKSGFRPDYATYIYTNNLKKLFPDVPVLIGGIEASLRRFTHYDYWQDSLKPSILAQCNADLLIYGNGEFVLPELIEKLQKGAKFSEITELPQSVFLTSNINFDKSNVIELFSNEECLVDKKKFAENFKNIEIQSNLIHAQRIIQKHGDKFLVVNPPKADLTQEEIDLTYKLPYTRLPHPKYAKRGHIPAYEMIKDSVNIHRGCFGGCSFCTISAHQGKFIMSRSEKSILDEVDKIVKMPDFSGHITDLGGPSANMYMMKGKDLSVCEKCKKNSCIFPVICPNLDSDHSYLTQLYKKVRNIGEIKQVTIGSGIRYDMFFDKNNQIKGDKKTYAEELIKYHVSGRLKVAPEHTSEEVLSVMRKPSFEFFRLFKKFFDETNAKIGKNQQLIPYFISSHPGCRLDDMAELAIETKSLNFRLEQVQDFTPTPLTAASVIYYSGIDPYTMQKVRCAKTKEEKTDQQMFFFWYKPEMKNKIKTKLAQINRKDLISQLFNK